MKILSIILVALLELIPKGPALLNPLQKRDSILVADQLEYGFEMKGVKAGTRFGLPDYSKTGNEDIVLVKNWELDTTKIYLRTMTYDLKARVVMAFFQEGEYQLNPVVVVRQEGEQVDTLMFTGAKLEVKSMPVDTATYVPHDIKAQIRYPLTFMELVPWIGGGLLLAGLVAALVWWFRKRSREKEAEKIKEPAHITALRNLDKYRGEKFWAPEKQKAFYSGVTDTLKVYMGARFGVDAPEMTTAEVFDALKAEKDISPELYDNTKELFEIADFVKFAKHSAPDDYNAKVVPTAVRFVTETYRAALEEGQEGDVL